MLYPFRCGVANKMLNCKMDLVSLGLSSVKINNHQVTAQVKINRQNLECADIDLFF